MKPNIALMLLICGYLSSCTYEVEREPERAPVPPPICYEGIVLGEDPNCQMGIINIGDPYYQLYWVELIGENRVSPLSTYVSTWNLPNEYKIEGAHLYFSVEDYSLANPLTCNALFGYQVVDFVNVSNIPCAVRGN